ncbi:hypothetical protein PR202_gb25854 [Eleusine coracana subsp. coracana]|uniref:TF-B3 domain-containing protein n=1 Tax=Eleusine coracana subsp. coracana TaxID=191504 RepID=A0AAV5FQ31_ELECO|nr:hypothetical protein PR202_gb25854 [Eleusine coracana subsp. coracana]
MASSGDPRADSRKQLRVLLPFSFDSLVSKSSDSAAAPAELTGLCTFQRIPDKLAEDIRSAQEALVVGKVKVWNVEVERDGDGAFLGRGWPEFASSCGVGAGWLVVVRHRGRGMLTVKAFDDSGCYVRELGAPPPAVHICSAETAKCRKDDSPRPQFIHCFPASFCCAIGLHETSMISLKTSLSSTGSWQVRLHPYKNTGHQFGSGWRMLCRENRIREGDICTFNIIETTLWHVDIEHYLFLVRSLHLPRIGADLDLAWMRFQEGEAELQGQQNDGDFADGQRWLVVVDSPSPTEGLPLTSAIPSTIAPPARNTEKPMQTSEPIEQPSSSVATVFHSSKLYLDYLPLQLYIIQRSQEFQSLVVSAHIPESSDVLMPSLPPAHNVSIPSLTPETTVEAVDKKAAEEQSKYVSLVSESANLETKLEGLKKERKDIQAALEAKNQEIANVETILARVPENYSARDYHHIGP